MQDKVFGEENNEFTREDETVIIEIKPTINETRELLCRVLDDEEASDTLAKVVHSNMNVDFPVELENLPCLPNKIGLWIDPIGRPIYICITYGKSQCMRFFLAMFLH